MEKNMFKKNHKIWKGNSLMKKLTAALLAALILFSAVSCSESAENAKTSAETSPTQTTDSPSAEEETVPEEETDPTYADKIAAVDYDGWTLNIANDGLNPEYFSSFTAEELTGDALNDAIYDRNIRVSDKFNITITEHTTGSAALIRNSVTAGTGDVGFGYVLLSECMGLITENYVLPVNEMPVVNLANPYWDKGSQETLTFGGKLYYGHCDISFDHYESMAVLFYNGEILADNGIETTPYELYTSGEWTLDKMYEMVTTAAKDENGDGKMDENNDTFGWAGREFEYLPSLYSSNVALVKWDTEKETYVMNVVDDTVMAVGDKLNQIINDTNLSLPGRNDTTRNLFKSGDVLFYSRLLGDFRNLRDQEDDYGIISYPSLEPNTDGQIYVQNSFTVMIPSDCSDTERLGTLIEALAADTYDNVMDIYFEKAVIGKGARDVESANLLKIFIGKRAYDVPYALGLGGAISAYNLGLDGGKYASAASRTEKSFDKAVAKALEAIIED